MSFRADAVEAGGAIAAGNGQQPPGPRADGPGVDPFMHIFHWGLVTLFVVAFVTGDEIERLHIAAGYTIAIAALIALRIIWGFIGPRHARFSDFVRSPAETPGYIGKAMRGQAPRYIGHNPAGGYPGRRCGTRRLRCRRRDLVDCAGHVAARRVRAGALRHLGRPPGRPRHYCWGCLTRARGGAARPSRADVHVVRSGRLCAAEHSRCRDALDHFATSGSK